MRIPATIRKIAAVIPRTSMDRLKMELAGVPQDQTYWLDQRQRPTELLLRNRTTHDSQTFVSRNRANAFASSVFCAVHPYTAWYRYRGDFQRIRHTTISIYTPWSLHWKKARSLVSSEVDNMDCGFRRRSCISGMRSVSGASIFVILCHAHPSAYCALHHRQEPDDPVK